MKKKRTQMLTSTASTASHTASNICAASYSPGIGVSLETSPRTAREVRSIGEAVVAVDLTVVVFSDVHRYINYDMLHPATHKEELTCHPKLLTSRDLHLRALYILRLGRFSLGTSSLPLLCKSLPCFGKLRELSSGQDSIQG